MSFLAGMIIALKQIIVEHPGVFVLPTNLTISLAKVVNSLMLLYMIL